MDARPSMGCVLEDPERRLRALSGAGVAAGPGATDGAEEVARVYEVKKVFGEFGRRRDPSIWSRPLNRTELKHEFLSEVVSQVTPDLTMCHRSLSFIVAGRLHEHLTCRGLRKGMGQVSHCMLRGF